LQLWDVCSDQEAVDLIRHTSDPQAASRSLVEHALQRFSTDNLSCMVVRFDNKALKHNQDEGSIGVDGDSKTSKRGVSEADAKVEEVKKHQGDDVELTTSNSAHETIVEETENEVKEDGTEPQSEAVSAAPKPS
jgi:protein phosphatase PTC1